MAGLIVVTGGTKGIGRAIIERFAAAGHDVCTCSRNKADLEALAADLTGRHKINVHHTQADLSKVSDVKLFTAFVAKLRQSVDVLVNNAGHFIPGEVTEEADGTLEAMISSNLYSAYYTTKGLVKDMKQRKTGHIFNMCSIASFTAYPDGGSYAIAKAAMLGFSRVLRAELKTHGVRVTAVMPGATLTASWEGTNLPNERFMKPEDVAETVYSAFSLSKQSVVEEIVIRPMLGDI